MFTRILLTQLFLFIFLLTNAQHKSSLGFTVSIDDQNIIGDNNRFSILSSTNYKPRFSCRLGVDYSKRTSKVNLFFKTGLRLVSIGLESDLVDLNVNFVPDPRFVTEIQRFQQVNYLAIPIMVRFETNPGEINFYFELGISPHFYVFTRSKEVTNLGTSTSIFRDDFREIGDAIQMAAIASAGINYNLSGKFQLFGQPTFRVHLWPQYISGFGDNLYNFGLELGVRKKFY